MFEILKLSLVWRRINELLSHKNAQKADSIKNSHTGAFWLFIFQWVFELKPFYSIMWCFWCSTNKQMNLNNLLDFISPLEWNIKWTGVISHVLWDFFCFDSHRAVSGWYSLSAKTLDSRHSYTHRPPPALLSIDYWLFSRSLEQSQINISLNVQ